MNELLNKIQQMVFALKYEEILNYFIWQNVKSIIVQKQSNYPFKYSQYGN